MLLVGIDWADKEHVYCLMDETGTTLSTGMVEHTAEGIEHSMAAVRARAKGPSDVLVAIETSHGPLVGVLLEHGCVGLAPSVPDAGASAGRFPRGTGDFLAPPSLPAQS